MGLDAIQKYCSNRATIHQTFISKASFCYHFHHFFSIASRSTMNSSDQYYHDNEFDRFNSITEEQQNHEELFSQEEESSSYAMMAYGDPSAGRGDKTFPEDSRIDDSYDAQHSLRRTSDNQNEDGSRDSFFEAKRPTFSKVTNSTSAFSHNQHDDATPFTKGDVAGSIYDQHMMVEQELYVEANKRQGKDTIMEQMEDENPSAGRSLRFEGGAATFNHDDHSNFQSEDNNGIRLQLFERDGQNYGEGEAGVIEKEPIVQDLRTMIEEKHANMQFLTNKLLQDVEMYVETLATTEQTYLAIRQTEHTEAERLDQCEAAVSHAIAGLRLPNSPGYDSMTQRSTARSSQLGQSPMNTSPRGRGIDEDDTNCNLQEEAETQLQDDYASARARQDS
jgi:hypothetical protein